MNQIHRTKLREFLIGQHDRFVAVDFVKNDGTQRSLNGRLRVTRHLKGGENKTVAQDNSYFTIFDVKARGYRTINLATASAIRASNAEFAVVG